jgi:hypothetical protein
MAYDAARVAQREGTPTIRFAAPPQRIDRWTIVQLPREASARLPSRGQVAVAGTINGHEFSAVLEPDGSSGHWLKLDGKLKKAAGASSGGNLRLEIQPLKEWPEPNLPEDLETALRASPLKIRALWEDITPMARWEWVRWVDATRNPETRKRRVEVSISKLNSGKRRPCCFNLASCTDPDLSQNGRLRTSE